ncbi:MAG TPA: nucleoside deaminase [Xanthobacteraceae bacterium]|nr:nucleoside deaminase [Xanthobacteraceae bacterium]
MTCRDDHASHHATAELNRRAVVAALASAATLSFTQLSTPDARAEAGAGTASAEDVRFMKIALNEARRGDYPFGAVIVKDGKVIARGRNLGRSHDDPTAHGEMVAIRRCLAAHGSSALKGSTLYTSGEPCVMCMGAIIWCGVGRLVYAASVAQIGEKMNQIMITSAEVAAKASWDPIKITGGVLASEAVPILAR